MKTPVLQALKSAPCLIFSLVLILLFAVNSCKKDDNITRPLSPPIAEAKTWFDNHIPTQPEPPAGNNLRHSASKKPVWNKAYTKTISIGQAVIVPLEYSSEIFTKVGKNQDKVYLKDISYLMLYKNKEGKFHAEVVTRIPDDTYLDNGKAAGKNFSGIVMVEDWWGKAIKIFRLEAGGAITYLSRPSVAHRDLGLNPMSGGMLAVADAPCEVTVWTNERGMYEVEVNCDNGNLHNRGQRPEDMPPRGNPWEDMGGGGGEGGLPSEDYGEEMPPHGEGGGSGSGDNNPPAPPAPNGLDTAMTAKFYQNEKARCALNKLMQNNYYKTALNQFIGENKPLDLRFKIEPIADPLVYGQAQPNPFDWNSTNIDLIINENRINDLPSIEVALTLLHEGIHAEIYRKLLSIHGTINLNMDNFPSLFKMYAEYRNEGEYQHQFMANYYIDVIGKVLKQYDNNQFSLDYYQALAWQGLEETDVYVGLNATTKAEIESKRNLLLSNRSKINCNDQNVE